MAADTSKLPSSIPHKIDTKTVIRAINYVPSAAPPPDSLLVAGAPGVADGLGVDARAEEVPLALSFELSKLWKKFCRTSCWVGPPFVGLGDAAARVGDATCDREPEELAPSADSPADGRLVPLRLRALRESAEALMLSGDGPASISVSARSTLGKLKLLLLIGPTTPAPAFSVGLRKAPRGSRSGFFEFSS